MLKKLFLYLLVFTMLLGEKKLFYNSEGVILYNISYSEIEILKQKQLDISKEVNLEEIIQQKNIDIIGKNRKSTIKYIEYDNNNKVFNVYYELKFVTPQSELFLDKTLIMGIYDENFNYLKLEKNPVYVFDKNSSLIEEIITMFDNGQLLFFKFYNDKNLKSSKYTYNGKDVYLIRNQKDGHLSFNDERIQKIFMPGIIDTKKKFILGTSDVIDPIKNNKLYKYDLETGNLEILKDFPNMGIILQTLIENDNKLIYWSLDSKYSKTEKKLYIFDLKRKKEEEMKISSNLAEKFYYSHEVRNINKELIEKFYKSK
jgi:hypothetical protein